jgi:uncharacterized protein
MEYFSLLIKPAGPDCNLACKYCFYTAKSSLFADGGRRMTFQTLERLINDYLSLGFAQNSFAWQGGEPTLMGLDFYKTVVELQNKYRRPNQQVSNSLQTNAVLLDEHWCEFLHDNNFLVGISLDGPQKYHDYYRLDRSGKGTFARVMSAIENCRRYGVEFNILALLNDKNAESPDELFDFFIAGGFKYLQFIPCVEAEAGKGKLASYSITPEQFGNFMTRVFDRWFAYGPTKLSIRFFDSLLNFIVFGRPSDCTFGRRCDGYVVVEHNGDVFCCDFFVDEKYRLGNMCQTPIEKLFASDIKRRFAEYKNKISNKCMVCRYSDICRGGCLKDRIVLGDDFSRPSILCDAYKKIFEYCVPKLTVLAADFVYSQGRKRGF